MAMLAEPRRKQKWTLNPRGKHWSEDTNKFGQKMLEKMGWTSGKGLGVNEQGMTEHIRVSFKDDAGGIGFKKDDMDKAWTEHQESFNEFLQKLQKRQNLDAVEEMEIKADTLSGKSLELKSKQSRARVHYQKFTRGKDIHRYSSKDLANIFGQKDLSTNHNTTKEKKAEDNEVSEPIGTQENRGGVVTINSGSMADYFKKKGHDFSKASKSKRNDQSTDSESEVQYAGFGFSLTPKKNDMEVQREEATSSNYAFENPCLRINSPENMQDDQVTSTRKRKNNYDNVESELSHHTKKLKENGYQSCFVNAGLSLENQSEKDISGKQFEVSRAEFGLANSALDITDEINEKRRVTFNDHVEYSTDSAKKKKGKAKLDKFEVENKKHKKKRKHDTTDSSVSTGFVNQALDVEDVSEEVNDNELNERKSKKTKKRKGSRASILETIEETPEEDKEASEEKLTTEEHVETIANDTVTSQESLKTKTKKKKKKRQAEKDDKDTKDRDSISCTEREKHAKEAKATRLQVEESVLSSNVIEENQEKTSTEKKKKKKKNKDYNISNIEKQEAVILDEPVQETEEAGTAVDCKKSKKKKHKIVTDDGSAEAETVNKDREVSDKENTKTDQEDVLKEKKLKKRKESQKSVDKSSDIDVAENPENIEGNSQDTSVDMSLKKDGEHSQVQRVMRSPWNEKARMSKKLLKSLFQRNSVQNFPGSNIHEIKGYGTDI